MDHQAKGPPTLLESVPYPRENLYDTEDFSPLFIFLFLLYFYLETLFLCSSEIQVLTIDVLSTETFHVEKKVYCYPGTVFEY